MSGNEWSSIAGLVGGLVALTAGVLILRNRETVARVNAELLRKYMGRAAENTARRSTPQEFTIVGVGGVIIGSLLIVFSTIGFFF